jgi:hypothetical protein
MLGIRSSRAIGLLAAATFALGTVMGLSSSATAAPQLCGYYHPVHYPGTDQHSDAGFWNNCSDTRVQVQAVGIYTPISWVNPHQDIAIDSLWVKVDDGKWKQNMTNACIIYPQEYNTCKLLKR